MCKDNWKLRAWRQGRGGRVKRKKVGGRRPRWHEGMGKKSAKGSSAEGEEKKGDVIWGKRSEKFL